MDIDIMLIQIVMNRF